MLSTAGSFHQRLDRVGTALVRGCPDRRGTSRAAIL
jgi:hypothetical protein